MCGTRKGNDFMPLDTFSEVNKRERERNDIHNDVQKDSSEKLFQTKISRTFAYMLKANNINVDQRIKIDRLDFEGIR